MVMAPRCFTFSDFPNQGLLSFQKLSGPDEDAVEHLLGKSPGEGVLLRRVIAGQEPRTGLEFDFRSMRELLAGWSPTESGGQVLDVAEGEAPKGDDDPGCFRKIGEQPSLARLDLDCGGTVIRWGASDDGGDQTIRELEAVIAVDRGWLIRKASIEESAE